MKTILKSGLIGAVCGVAGNYLLAIAVSLTLNLGYLMPYPAALPERVGGELNAVLLIAALCAAAGAGVGLAVGFAHARALRPARRRAGAIVSAAACPLAVALLVMCVA